MSVPLFGDVAAMYRLKYTPDTAPVAVACEHCGVEYDAKPTACRNCGSRHLKRVR